MAQITVNMITASQILNTASELCSYLVVGAVHILAEGMAQGVGLHILAALEVGLHILAVLEVGLHIRAVRKGVDHILAELAHHTVALL